MSLPASVTLVPTVSGYVYRDATGSVPEGARVVCVPRTKTVVVDDAKVTLPTKLVALVTAAGALPDDFALPTAGADGVYYDIIEDFAGGRAKFTILVLPTDTEKNLATEAPVVPPEDLESTRGPAGNTLFATFDISPSTGQLSVTTPEGFAGVTFAIDDDGYLGVTI